MKTLYCWRCKAEMPMLDETEWSSIEPLFALGIADTKDQRAREGIALSESLIARHSRPVLEEYERLTGFAETNVNAVAHHRLALYGPACSGCGKPLRTPLATICAYCGRTKAGGLSK